MQELIRFIAASLVDRPDEVQVTETEQDGTTVLELTVAKEDLGKVIGKQGQTAKAMRALLAAAASKTDKRFRLEILEQDDR
jgi:predicted RNA-binding protein YlqC (UPF0109 family)